MFGRSVGIAATYVLGASAFILPQGIAPASNSEASDLSISVVNPKSQIITVPCSECAFPTIQEKVEDVEQDDDFFWIQGGANSLLLNFTVSEDGKHLQLNGVVIYPPQFGQTGWFEPEDIYVKQVPSQADMVDIRSGEVRSTDLKLTGYGLIAAKMEELSPNGDMLVPLRLEMMAVEEERIDIDEVAIKLLQTGDGELLIMDVESIPSSHLMFEDEPFPPPGPDGMPEDMDFPPYHGPPHHGPPPHDGPQECNMLPEPLCKLKAMIESKIDQAMASPSGDFRKKGGCHGRKGPHGKKLPGHIKPHFNRPGHDDFVHHEDGADGVDRPNQEDRPKHHHGRPHHMRPHGQHHGHHRHPHFFGHHFLHSFAKGLVAVLIPVMAGITVGMTVSLLGLVVGRLIGFVWIKFARGGRRGYASVAQQEAVVEEGKNKPMIAEMEALPVYEDAPAYEATEKE
ncbi:hypothetical protein LTR85_011007 [Meristemomyces frigidus]|nr:hypothetical protein LTR85_011007 [Meristemomyces frigidus]